MCILLCFPRLTSPGAPIPSGAPYIILACQTNVDILVISETWLIKTVPDTDVSSTVYNVFKSDGVDRGGGVAIFTNDNLNVSVSLSC